MPAEQRAGCPRRRSPGGAYVNSTYEKSALPAASTYNGTIGCLQQGPDLLDSYAAVSRTCVGAKNLEEGCTSPTGRGGTELDSWNGRVTSEPDSREITRLPFIPLWVPLHEKFPFQQLTSMMTPYSICPLLPNFPFVHSPAVFYPDLQAFLPCSEAGAAVRLDVSSGTSEEPPTTRDGASAGDVPLPTQPGWGATDIKPAPWGSAGSPEPVLNETDEKERTVAAGRRGCRSLSDSWDAGAARNRRRAIGRFSNQRTAVQPSIDATKDGNLVHLLSKGSGSKACKPSRSASEGTCLSGWLSDEHSSRDGAGNSFGKKDAATETGAAAPLSPLSTLPKRGNGETAGTRAKEAGAVNMTTLNYLKSASASLSLLNRRLLLLPVVLPWALTVAFYTYVPRQVRRQLQWLFPNVLLLIVFIITLAACLQCRFSILVDLIVLTLQLCSWSLLAFLSPTSGDRSSSTIKPYPRKYKSATIAASAKNMCPSDGPRDTGRKAADAATPPTHAGKAQDEDCLPTALPRTKYSTRTPPLRCEREAAAAMSPEDDTLSLSSGVIGLAREIHKGPNELLEGPAVVPVGSGVVKHSGAAGEGDTSEGDVLASAYAEDESNRQREALRARPPEVPGAKKTTGPASVRSLGTACWTPTATEAGETHSMDDVVGGAALELEFPKTGQQDEEEETEREKQTQTGKTPAERKRTTMQPARACQKNAEENLSESCQQGMQDDERKQQQRNETENTLGPLNAACCNLGIREVCCRASVTTASPREGDDCSFVVESPATVREQQPATAAARGKDLAMQQEVEVPTLFLEDAQASPCADTAAEPVHAASLLLADALRDMCVYSAFPDAATAAVAPPTAQAAAEVNKGWRQGGENLQPFVNTLEAVVEERGEEILIKSDETSRLRLPPPSPALSHPSKLVTAETPGAAAEASVVTSAQGKIVSVAGTAEGVAVSPSVAASFRGAHNAVNEQKESFGQDIDSSEREKRPETTALNCRPIENEKVGSAATALAEYSFLEDEGQREASWILQQKAQPASSCALFVFKGTHNQAPAAAAGDMTPIIAGNEQRDYHAKSDGRANEEGQREKGNFGEDSLKLQNLIMAVTEPHVTGLARGAEEEHSVGLGREQGDDEANSCFWPSFRDEQNFSHPLQQQQEQQLSQYLCNAGTTSHVKHSVTLATAPTTGMDKLETAGDEQLNGDLEDCDFSVAEAFYIGLSSDEFVDTTTEQPSHYEETNGELPCAAGLPERREAFPLYHPEQGAQSEWGAGVAAAASASVDPKLSSWQADSFSAATPVAGFAAVKGGARGRSASLVENLQQQLKETPPVHSPVDDVCIPEALSALSCVDASSPVTQCDRQQQQEPQPQAERQQQVMGSYLPLSFARSPLLATEDNMMWCADASLTTLRQGKVQNMVGDVFSPQACGTALSHDLHSAQGAVAARAIENNSSVVANAASLRATGVVTSNSLAVPPAMEAAAAELQQSPEAVCAARFPGRGQAATTAAGAASTSSSALGRWGLPAAAGGTSVLAAAPRPLFPEAITAAFPVEGGTSFLEPAGAIESDFSVCEGATMRIAEVKSATTAAAGYSPISVPAASHAETALQPARLGEIDAPAFQAGRLTAAPTVLSSPPTISAGKEEAAAAAGVGEGTRVNSLRLPGKDATMLCRQEQQEAAEKDNLTGTPASSAPDTESPGEPAAAAVATGRAGRSSYAAKGGGGTTRGANTTRRANSAESRVMMQHYMALVKDCYRSKDSNGALQVLRLLQKEKRVQPDTQLLNYILVVCVAAGSRDMTQRLFNLMEASGCADLVTYNTVLKSFVELEDLESAEKLLHRMQKNPNITPDGVTFNLMVNACVVCRQHEKAWEYIEKIKAANLTPDKFTISSVIKSLQPGQNRYHISRALKLMEGVDVCEDVLLLSTCLDACARLGKCDLLSSLLKSFEKSNLRLNAHAYGTVIKAYGRLGDMSRVWELWQQQAKENIMPTSYTYGCMLDCLTTNNQVVAALEMFREMVGAGVADAVHFSVLIKGLTKHRAEGARLAIAAYEMLRSSRSDSSCSSATARRDSCSTGIPSVTSSVLEGSNESNSLSVSTGCEEEMVGLDAPRRGEAALRRPRTEDGTGEGTEEKRKKEEADVLSAARFAAAPADDDAAPPQPGVNCYMQALNTISYNALLHLCVSTGHLKEALQIFEDMQHHPRAVPDLITYSSIIKGLCCSSVPQGLELALQLFQIMQQRAHIRADAIIYNTLIQGAATRKRVQLVEMLLQHMIDNGVPPSSYTLCQCVKLYGKCNNLRRVLELHHELPARFHFEADEYVHTAMISACSQNGAPLLAARVALDACAAGQQLSTTMLRKVLFNLRQQRHHAEEQVDCTEPDARRATVDHVLDELKQLIRKRHNQDQQQQQRQVAQHPQQQPQLPTQLLRVPELTRHSQQNEQQKQRVGEGHAAASDVAGTRICQNSRSSSRAARGGDGSVGCQAAAMQQDQQRQEQMQQRFCRQERHQQRQQRLKQPHFRHQQPQRPHYRQQQPQQKQQGQHQPQLYRYHVQGRLRKHEQQELGYQNSGMRTLAGSHRGATEKHTEPQQQQHARGGQGEKKLRVDRKVTPQ